MIDLHSHFLFGIDDGSKDLATSMEMLRQAKELGITHLLATPHVDEQTSDETIGTIKKNFSEISDRIKKEKISLNIRLGAELAYDAGLLNLSEQTWIYIDSDHKYLLLEMPLFNLPLNVADLLFQLRLKNIIPIIAHPERNVNIQKNISILQDWIRQDCIIQLNAGSIVGKFGKICQSVAEELLVEKIVHFVGSDAHDPRHRNYFVLKDAYQRISEKYGDEFASILFNQNPERIWKGDQVIKMDLPVRKRYQKISRKIFQKLNIFR